jgi:Peptidase family M23
MLKVQILGALGAVALFGCAANDPLPSEAAPEPRTSAAAAASRQSDYGQNTRFSWTGELTQGGFIKGLAPDGAVSVTVGDTPVELRPDGTFFAAFDRDSPTALQLRAQLDSGQLHGETLTIIPRQWQIEHVNAAKRNGSGSDEAYWKIREPEYNAINAARAQKTGATGWSQDFIWPVKGRISGQFGRQRIFNGEPADYHSGIDIAPGNGVPFVAPADGVVVLARTGFSLEGGLIIIDHGGGLNSAFLHASKIVVREGQNVAQGQHIGNVGATGRASGPHLHWSLKWQDTRLDPLLFTGPMN